MQKLKKSQTKRRPYITIFLNGTCKGKGIGLNSICIISEFISTQNFSSFLQSIYEIIIIFEKIVKFRYYQNYGKIKEF